MKVNKILKINGTQIDKNQLQNHLQKIASSHNLINYSEKETYPVPHMLESFKIIREVYDLLNEQLKLGIEIHPAGEWLLDNLYIIEQTVKQIQRDLTLQKYKNFVGISNGNYKGFARIYVLASEIVAYTDNKIEKLDLEEYLISYQLKKTLSMEEIWNIGTFLQIAIIENIREICERIYNSQLQKQKAENIVERLVENKAKSDLKFKVNEKRKIERDVIENIKYPFVEYMSYILKRYGKKAYGYLNALEEAVEMTGTTVSDIIKKEHFDIAVRKVSMANSITSIKRIQRINFLEIFEKINGVEELLKQDPAEVYNNMTDKTKEYYRNSIKEISKKTKISEIYIARKMLEIALCKKKGSKEFHIGYYLIGDGINELYDALGYKNNNKISNKNKVKSYITANLAFTILISLVVSYVINLRANNIWIFILSFIVFFIPISELSIQLIQYILSKIVKPKMLPKIDFSNGIDEAHSTMVVIPTIVKSREKVQELMKKLEVFYLANQSENLYFTLLGDCSQSTLREEKSDNEVIEEGIKLANELNDKYKTQEGKLPIFNFLYRGRVWNEKESCYLGWERKRGMITRFNSYLLGKTKNTFRTNTMEEYSEERKNTNIKYVITLDADTDLILNSAFELVGAMAHILNEPVIDEKKKIVIDGYGIIQPRVGINLEISYKSIFTKLFAGSGGVDSYSNAISDIYQDNFREGIFAGKGIYDLKVFSSVLENVIPENTVLSHDLLEGCYLRCGLATDILLMDGYPTKYNSFINRLSRWIRGDWQIYSWLKNGSISLLSKYKILDNLRRSLVEISLLVAMLYVSIIGIINNIKIYPYILIISIIGIIPSILEIINKFVFRKDGEQKQKTFAPKITGIKGSFLRGIITLGCVPYKAYISAKAIGITIYRMCISHRNLLEWTTSEEAEKQAKSDLASYYNQMAFNIFLGVVTVGFSLLRQNLFGVLLGILWFITPMIMWFISKENIKNEAIDELNQDEKDYVLEIGRRTWKFFETYLNEENNYLIPDNYQEGRREKIVKRTSSTNIGLSLLAVISAYDLGYIDLQKAIDLLDSIINNVSNLQKWNGHLYNWYNIDTMEPLIPRYISTVDSGNFIGYLFVIKTFLNNLVMYPNKENIEINKEKVNSLINIVDSLITNCDFSVLYQQEQQIFSIGFNIEEGKLTDSYYDLLASEARQASLVAIAKKDIPAKHWNYLSRTLTILDKYKGLISWSGTAFEYLMPNINIPTYEGSLLEESSNFLVMSQMKYAQQLGIPWGVSESAFNLKDLQSNYQYKAFGIPWLGLKRGLEDDQVVSAYGGILAIDKKPKEEIENLKILEKLGMYDKYGFYEAIDFTPERVEKGKTSSVVKTYMAHHQGLILLSINNLFNKRVLQKRFMQNPEIEAVSILLQETMPETFITTKEKKEKVEKLKYKDYEAYIQRTYNKIDERLITGNVISNENYVIAMNQKGQGVSKYNDIYINRFKVTDDYPQGIFFTFKNIKNKKVWSSNYNHNDKDIQYQISFMPDRDEQELISGNIKTKIKTTVSSNDPVELRRVVLQNTGNEEEIVEVSSYFEPVLSKKEQDYAHPAFNNLFLIMNFDEQTNSIIVKRRKREKDAQEFYLMANLNTNAETVGELEYEINEEKFMGRGNIGIPEMIKNSMPFSKKVGLVTEPIVALKRTIKIKPNSEVCVDFIVSVGENEEYIRENLEKYKSCEYVKTEFDLSKAKVEAESRYLRVKGKEMEIYQKMLSYMIFDSSVRSVRLQKQDKVNCKQEDLWKYGISGDLPIILVKVKDVNDQYVIREILKAYEFFRIKKFNVEIVILNEEKHSYENYLREEIEGNILNSHMGYMKNIKGGIFTLSKNEIDKNDIKLLETMAIIVIDSSKGSLKNNIKEIEEEYLENYKEISEEQKGNVIIEDEKAEVGTLINENELKYFNEFGGFSADGKEYHIKVSKENRLPTVWSHIMANENFGSVVTENLGGYSWYKNSRLNRVSSWANNPSYDIPSEVIYLKDNESGKCWSLGLNPMPDNEDYYVTYGLGYSKYMHNSNGIEQILEVFVPKEDSCKVSILTLKNTTPNHKKMKLYYYMKPVIGEDEIKSDGFININYDRNNNLVLAESLYNADIENMKIFASCSEKISSYTGDRSFFFGDGDISNPAALRKVMLNNENSLGKRACIAYEIEIELESFAEKEISIVLGAQVDSIDCKNIAYKYSKISNCTQELDIVKNFWNELLGRVQVYTPLESMNILLNGWVPYQVIACRLLGRSGYYQSGGAYGFRDQLQDTLALKYFDPELLKKQIILHSKHQFLEGDVEHWWHEENAKGIRTRMSDDLLWLVYLTLEYINFTDDKNILDMVTPYLKGKVLEDNEVERYDKYVHSEEEGTLYEHCIKAIDRTLDFGENGFPKIGTGDWNDGFSEVGKNGKGESVWLGFFLYTILDRFIELCKYKNDEDRAIKYEEVKNQLKKNLNTNGWDGRWYKRAFMDDGNILGSMENDECRIDSIAQSWSIISNAGDNDKKYISMESLENHLIDKENGIIKLLDPPFDKGKFEPGYIKAYMPGVRENGGQYTHAAIWVILAEAMLGFGDKALELYRMINPIEHSRTKDASKKYKVEPFVVPADIYGAGNMAGRGGWTWYTGSASWYYKVGLENILGLKVEKGYIIFVPCIPKDWKEYEIKYKWKESIYNIVIKNPNGKNCGVEKVILNDLEVENKIKLDGSNNIYNIEVIM